MNKKIIFLMMALVLVFVGCGGGKEGVVATVDGEDISQEKFDLYYKIQRESFVSQLGEEALEEPFQGDRLNRTTGEILRENLLNSLIQNQVILNKANEADLGDIDSKVDEQISMEKEFIGEDVFQENLDDLGITEEQYKEITKDNILVSEYRAQRMAEYEITDEEIEEFYNTHKDALVQANARHILVETEEEAKNAKERIDNGEDFGEVAKEISQDPGSAVNGGDLGYFVKGQMVAPFEDFVFSSEIGEISDPIKSDFGYHIIEVVDVKSSLEDFKDEIDGQLRIEKFNNEVMEAVDSADVDKHIDLSKEPESIQEELKNKDTENKETENTEQPVDDNTADENEETEEDDNN